ncbi:DUF1624 domain-containing protein [Nostoc ellipsosporum NOK]|nr:DUF1624 domain-containing protein [Nostoc ellipsosporum NOK]
MQPNPAYDKRIISIDILRGVVMIIMALDHVRDFFHVDALQGDPLDLASTTPVLFFTRWITHFCAPVFVFLSGMSAFISGQNKSKSELSLFLIKRGIWLIIVELVIISFALSFDPLYRFFLLQVIWAIGWSMILLGLLLRLGYKAILITGVVLVVAHNLTDIYPPDSKGTAGVLWQLFVTSNAVYPVGERIIFAAYAILPWAGVMMLGYAAGALYARGVDATLRRRRLLIAGTCTILFFILLRWSNSYGDPGPWSPQPREGFTFLSFINTAKYPPSLLYVCMTLGPAFLLLAFLEKAKGAVARVMMVYGKVPFFYYVLHFFLIHLLCVVVFFMQGYGVDEIRDLRSPFLFVPVGFGFELPGVYLVWFSVVASLYLPCKWFGRYKATHRQWWLSYL